jgi:hypothetical protein
MGAFVFTLWRFGFSRLGVTDVVGWRRLVGRLWWRLSERAALDALRRPAPVIMHWGAGDMLLPLCGASRDEYRTVEADRVNCPRCLDRGWLKKIQRDVNTR